MSEVPGAAFIRAVVPADGFNLDYAEAGPAAAAVTIVSLPGSAGLEMSTAKDRLTQEYRVIEINPPGWGGRTDLNRKLTQRELGELLGAAAAALVDGPFVVLGTSMGGTNALYLAAGAPDRVRGVVLEGSMAPAEPGDLRQPPIDPANLPPEPEGGYPLPPTNPKKPWATPEYVAKQMADRFAMFRWVEPDLAATDAVAVVRDREIPVLALLGEDDEILSPSQEKTIRERLPQADFRLVPGGSHDLQNTEPDAFVAAVRGFVAGLGDRDRTGH